jgi:hypothetical protein
MYCAQPFGKEVRREREHVIGRNFVPKGSLAARWNVVGYACKRCNGEKGRLENDLSAITLRPDIWGRFEPQERMIEEARRKESARSQKTGKSVRNSAEEMTITGQIMPGVTITGNFVSGPQLDDERACRLAWFHISAFFYFITFDKKERKGSVLPWTYAPVAVVARGDWGNDQMLGFQELIADWPHAVHAVSANVYFKAIIRRASEKIPPLWAWGLEWNRNYRLIGFFGDRNAVKAAISRLPVLRNDVVEQTSEVTTTIRVEVPLRPEEDRLFFPP